MVSANDKASELAREIYDLAEKVTITEEPLWFIRKVPTPEAIALVLRPHLGEERWIPVSERLPENADWVLVYASSNDGDLDPKVNVAFWDEDRWEGEITIVAEVTHWCPLPAPPTEGGRS